MPFSLLFQRKQYRLPLVPATAYIQNDYGSQDHTDSHNGQCSRPSVRHCEVNCKGYCRSGDCDDYDS